MNNLKKIEQFQAQILKYPQLEVPTEHFFADGIYARQMRCVAGTIIVGKVHKRDHFVLLLQGEVSLSNEDGSERVIAPALIVAKAGTKRALYFHKDSVWVNVHRTSETEIEKIEDELVEPDPTSPFLPGNKLPALEDKTCHS